MNKKPILIEIDGPDFAGKSTLIEALKQDKLFDTFNFCRLPGTSSLGERLRPIVKEVNMQGNTSLGIALAGMSDAYYFMANMHSNIITDRGLSSVLMYQFVLDKSYKDDPLLSEAVFNSLRKQVESTFDYWRILLFVKPETILDRKEKRGVEQSDKYDNLNMEKLELMYNTYRQIASDSAHFDINKTLTIDVDYLSIDNEVNQVKKFVQERIM